MSCQLSEKGLQIGSADASKEQMGCCSKGSLCAAQFWKEVEQLTISLHRESRTLNNVSRAITQSSVPLSPQRIIEKQTFGCQQQVCHQNRCKEKWPQPSAPETMQGSDKGQHGTVVCCIPDHLYWRPDKWGNGSVSESQRLTMDLKGGGVGRWIPIQQEELGKFLL